MRNPYSKTSLTLFGLFALVAAPAAADTTQEPPSRSGLYVGVFGAGTAAEVAGTSLRGDGNFGSNAQSESADDNLHGSGAGVSLGYRHHYDNGLVVGVEADGTWLHQEGREDTRVNSSNPWNGMTQASILREARWISTARLLLGYTLGRFELNLTGGVAVASFSETRTQYEGVSSPAQTLPRFSDTDRATPRGWTLGVGGAWHITEKWSLRLDYLRARFEEVDFSFPNARGGVVSGAGFASVQGRTVQNDITLDLLRLGLTYTFGAGR